MATPSIDTRAGAAHRRGLLRASGLALALLATGCAAPPREAAGPAAPGDDMAARWQREAEMNRRWQNRPLPQLLDALGRPLIFMNIPGGGNPPGFVVVYGKDGSTGCIDSFTMNLGEVPTVRTYFCR